MFFAVYTRREPLQTLPHCFVIDLYCSGSYADPNNLEPLAESLLGLAAPALKAAGAQRRLSFHGSIQETRRLFTFNPLHGFRRSIHSRTLRGLQK
jgi:hypothetical protein